MSDDKVVNDGHVLDAECGEPKWWDYENEHVDKDEYEQWNHAADAAGVQE